MSVGHSSSNDGASSNTSPTVYTRGDSTLWDDNELIRLWNEQLECENIAQGAQTEDEKQRLKAAIQAALNDQDEPLGSSALMSQRNRATSQNELEEKLYSEQEEEEEEEEQEQEEQEKMSEQWEQEQQKNKQNKRLEPMNNNDVRQIKGKGVEEIWAPRQEMNHHSKEQHLLSKQQREQSYERQYTRNSGVHARNKHLSETADHYAMPAKEQQHHHACLLSVSHLPDNVRGLVESFYNAGFEAGYYVAQSERKEQHERTYRESHIDKRNNAVYSHCENWTKRKRSDR